MSGINESVLLSVNRIRTEFRDDKGNLYPGTGTGFWVSLRQEESLVSAFVTNRHNLDPNMLWPGKGFVLAKSEIEIRRFERSEPGRDETSDHDEISHEGDWPRPETAMWSIPVDAWVLHPTADCAAVIGPDFAGLPEGFRPFTELYAEMKIATDYWLANNVPVMDFASFVGFAGSNGQPWWDQKWNLPIARLATLASPPSMPFTNPAIKSGNVGLVSGLSFRGSSGSPLFVHEKGMRLRRFFLMLRPDLRGYQGPSPLDHADSSYRPSMLIGIMSGHFWDGKEPEMFRHSGLSYYTRASAIREVLGLVEEDG